MTTDIAEERITTLNDRPIQQGQWVLYWMQQSQRAHDNPALEFAIAQANRLDLPVWVIFALTDDYPDANLRHYRFMLEGLAETRRLLASRRIGLAVRKGDPVAVVQPLLDRTALLVGDVGYTRHQREWRKTIARHAPCRTVAVEGDVVVPVAVASPKAEYAARTIRPKIHKHQGRFLVQCPRYRPRHESVAVAGESLDLADLDAVLSGLAIDRTVPAATPFYKGGSGEAQQRLHRFIRHHLENYQRNRSHPQADDISTMSPYLHFGQISPVTLALAIAHAPTGSPADRDARSGG